MSDFENLIYNYATTIKKENRFNSAGKSFYIAKNDIVNGYYWFYETDDFIIDIHDLKVYKDYIETELPEMINYFFIASSYIISGNGEIFDPYQIIEPSSIFIMDNSKKYKKMMLHANSNYLAVGIRFKEKMIDEKYLKTKNPNKKNISKIFIETTTSVVKPISKLAKEIINCKMDKNSAKLFFEAKAREWMSIILDAYYSNSEINLTETDKNSIENVAKYIENHYAFNIPQEFLEKIATMSGTKLKATFKQRYNMSITEFTQRKRMNIAETLLLTTDLELKSIAKAVGYNSPSRFSTLYKRYKGILPKESRQKINFK